MERRFGKYYRSSFLLKGDFSEPVTQNTKRFVRCFWALDRSLAYSRHYPAIHWLNSYSEYLNDLEEWFTREVDAEFLLIRRQMLSLLQEESKLMEIVKLIGADILPEEQKLILDVTKLIRHPSRRRQAPETWRLRPAPSPNSPDESSATMNNTAEAARSVKHLVEDIRGVVGGFKV